MKFAVPVWCTVECQSAGNKQTYIFDFSGFRSRVDDISILV